MRTYPTKSSKHKHARVQPVHTLRSKHGDTRKTDVTERIYSRNSSAVSRATINTSDDTRTDVMSRNGAKSSTFTTTSCTHTHEHSQRRNTKQLEDDNTGTEKNQTKVEEETNGMTGIKEQKGSINIDVQRKVSFKTKRLFEQEERALQRRDHVLQRFRSLSHIIVFCFRCVKIHSSRYVTVACCRTFFLISYLMILRSLWNMCAWFFSDVNHVSSLYLC